MRVTVEVNESRAHTTLVPKQAGRWMRISPEGESVSLRVGVDILKLPLIRVDQAKLLRGFLNPREVYALARGKAREISR